jgi:hypothetical protein
MRSAKKGFFASLFGRRRKKDDFEPTLAYALGASAGRALAPWAPELPFARAEPVDLEALLEELRAARGWICSFHLDTDVPALVLLIPDGWLARIAEKADDGSLPSPVKALLEGSADFLRFNSPAGFHASLGRFDPDSPFLTWRLSGGIPFKLASRDDRSLAIYACVAEDAAEAFQASLRDDRDAAEALRSFLLVGHETPALPIDSLDLHAPRELLLGSLFLPARVECGKQTLETLFETLSAPSGSEALREAPGTWIAAVCEAALPAGVKRLRHWYFFPSGEAESPQMAAETCKAIASCLLRSALPRMTDSLGTGIGKPALGTGVKPEPGPDKGWLLLGGRLHLGSSRIPVRLLVDSASLTPFLEKHAPPAVTASIAGKPAQVLSLALTLNEALLRGKLSTLPRAFSDPGFGEGFFPFSAFCDLVTDRDLAVVLQNYAPNAMEGRTLRRLFSYSEQSADAQGNPVNRAKTPTAYGEKRLLRLMPQRLRDIWERSPSRELGSREDYIRMNQEAMEGIEKAARRNALLLSPRARYILSEMVMPPLREAQRERMRALAASGVPFARLRGMSRQQLQQLLGAQPARALCLSLLGAEGELAFVRQSLSATRGTELGEDLRRARKQMDQGTLAYEDVIQAKNDLEEAALRVMEEAAKSSAREAARRHGESAAAPRRESAAAPRRGPPM